MDRKGVYMTGGETQAQGGRVAIGKRHQKKICGVCGKEFISNQANQLYCSAECLKEHRRQDRPTGRIKPRACSRCGEEFDVSVHSRRTLCFKCEEVRRKEWANRNVNDFWKKENDEPEYVEPEPEPVVPVRAVLRVDPGKLPKPMFKVSRPKEEEKESVQEPPVKKFNQKIYGGKAGAPFTPEEDDLIMGMNEAGETFSAIAVAVGRTPMSVKLRLNALVGRSEVLKVP